MISSRVKLKVQSVKALRDPESREAYQVEFVEVRTRPPMVMVSSPDVPEEINKMVVQVTKSFQGILPGVEHRLSCVHWQFPQPIHQGQGPQSGARAVGNVSDINHGQPPCVVFQEQPELSSPTSS